MRLWLFDRIRRLLAGLNVANVHPRRYEVIAQEWDQFESGWGRTSGGYSLHLTEADRLSFVAHQEELNKKSETYFVADSVPVVEYVDKATYRKVKASRNGVWWREEDRRLHMSR